LWPANDIPQLTQFAIVNRIPTHGLRQLELYLHTHAALSVDDSVEANRAFVISIARKSGPH